MPTDFNAEAPNRPGVSVGEDLADQLLAKTFEALGLQWAGERLTAWVLLKLASPHQDGENGHRAGFCHRCADLYAAGSQAVAAWQAAVREDDTARSEASEAFEILSARPDNDGDPAQTTVRATGLAAVQALAAALAGTPWEETRVVGARIAAQTGVQLQPGNQPLYRADPARPPPPQGPGHAGDR